MTQSEEVYKMEARVIQSRIDRRYANPTKDLPNSDEVWAWIKARRPAWEESDWERVYQLVKI